MKAWVELTEQDIRKAIRFYIADHLGISVPEKDIQVQVKSKQKYRSEWEEAAIRCDFEATVEKAALS